MSWKLSGKCANDEEVIKDVIDRNRDIFFDPKLVSQGKNYCHDCLVKDQCFLEGIQPIYYAHLPPGIWGGASLKERRKFLRTLKKRIVIQLEQAQALLQGDEYPNAS
jgi:hypothetical protein